MLATPVKLVAYVLPALSLLLGTGISSASAQVIDQRRAAATSFQNLFSVEAYIGLLTGESRELVFDPATGRKMSELFWTIDRATVFGGTITVTPLSWLSVRASGWVPISSKNKMQDYDWLVTPFNDWSDLSTHHDTPTTRAYMADLGVSVQVFNAVLPTITPTNVSFHALAGYRWLNMGWSANGGSYVYSTNPGFRDDVGNFAAGQPVITYEQWFNTPYLGIGINAARERWTFGTEVTGSLWGGARDRDDHVARTTLFTESFSGVMMLGVNTRVDYALTQSFSLFSKFDYQRYYEVKADSTAFNYGTGTTTVTTGDAAGLDHYSLMLSVGLKAGFYPVAR